MSELIAVLHKDMKRWHEWVFPIETVSYIICWLFKPECTTPIALCIHGKVSDTRPSYMSSYSYTIFVYLSRAKLRENYIIIQMCVLYNIQ